jgi:hypothetical protein
MLCIAIIIIVIISSSSSSSSSIHSPLHIGLIDVHGMNQASYNKYLQVYMYTKIVYKSVKLILSKMQLSSLYGCCHLNICGLRNMFLKMAVDVLC